MRFGPQCQQMLPNHMQCANECAKKDGEYELYCLLHQQYNANKAVEETASKTNNSNPDGTPVDNL